MKPANKEARTATPANMYWLLRAAILSPELAATLDVPAAAAAEFVVPTPAPAPAAVVDFVAATVDDVLMPELTADPDAALDAEFPEAATTGTIGTRVAALEPEAAAAAAVEAALDCAEMTAVEAMGVAAAVAP